MIYLDTSVVVDIWRGRYPAVERRLQAEIEAGRPLLLSTIVLHELRYGAEMSERREANHDRISEFLSAPITVVAFDAEDAAEAGAVRAETRHAPIGPFDMLIAAQARRGGAILASANLAEFRRVPGLIVQDWRQP